jgi:hypothetical protein
MHSRSSRLQYEIFIVSLPPLTPHMEERVGVEAQYNIMASKVLFSRSIEVELAVVAHTLNGPELCC